MAASLTDKISDTRNAARPNSARVASPRIVGATTLSCDSLTGWPTASKVHFVTYQIDSNSNPVAGTQLDCYGIVSGSSITSFTIVDGTDSGNAVNDVVEMLPTAAWGQDLADALTSTHNRSGGLKSGITLPLPTIADFTNATHTHATAAQGGTLTHTAFPTGAVVQVVSTNSTAYASGTTQIPLDDTIPQNTEGTQFMSLAITPKSATNQLVIEVLAYHSDDGAVVDLIGALFQDTTANALSAVSIVQAGTTYKELLILRYVMTAGTTSSTTFKYRAGPGSATTIYFNGSGARLFGGVAGSNMTITESKA